MDLAVDYFASQRQGKELASHRDDPLHRVATPFQLTLPGGSTAEANLAQVRLEGRERLALFWYEIDGRSVRGKYLAKWLTLRSTLLHGRSDGAAIVLLVDLDERGAAAAEQRLRELGPLVHEALRRLMEPRR